MKYAAGKVAGALFFVAASQFVIGMVVAEARYAGYSISANYISDLGVGPSALIFNSSVFLMGLLILIGAYFVRRAFNFKLLTLLLILTAIGAMGVGVFTENSGNAHPIVSLIAFLFGGLSSIASYRLLKRPFSVIAVILGLMALGALGLFGAQIYLGLGVGGMERMIVYPILMWGAGFGGYLLANHEKTDVQKPQKS
ncbi:MAG: DUF998 domain-containing protein [Candidatus Bathyarchaeia archaeon]|jgi:hypothetical membrane protein